MYINRQQHNPITGDTQLSPASFGLSMKDINEAASLNLKSALNAGGLSLTADHYRELEYISNQKFGGLDPSSGIFSGPLVPNIKMNGKSPGLYATHQSIGFWGGDEWKSFIANDGRFQFLGDAKNYIRWNGNALEIKGTLQMLDGRNIEDVIKDSETMDLVDFEKGSDSKWRMFINSQNLRPYTIPQGSSGVYMTSAGLFAMKNGKSTFELNANSGDALFRGKVYATGGEFKGNITSTATITGGTIISSSQRNSERVVIDSQGFASYKAGFNYPSIQIRGSSLVFGESSNGDVITLSQRGAYNGFQELRLEGSLYPTQLRVFSGNMLIYDGNRWIPLYEYIRDIVRANTP